MKLFAMFVLIATATQAFAQETTVQTRTIPTGRETVIAGTIFSECSTTALTENFAPRSPFAIVSAPVRYKTCREYTVAKYNVKKTWGGWSEELDEIPGTSSVMYKMESGSKEAIESVAGREGRNVSQMEYSLALSNVIGQCFQNENILLRIAAPLEDTNCGQRQ